MSRGQIKFDLGQKIECSIVLVPISLIDCLDKCELERPTTLGLTFLDEVVAENDTTVLGVNHDKLKASWSRIRETEIQIGAEIYKPFEKDQMLTDPVIILIILIVIALGYNLLKLKYCFSMFLTSC